VDERVLGQVLSPTTLRLLSPVSIIPLILHTHISLIYHRHYSTLATYSAVTRHTTNYCRIHSATEPLTFFVTTRWLWRWW